MDENGRADGDDRVARAQPTPQFGGGRRIAHEICFYYRGKLCSYDSAYDMGYAGFSPGELLTSAVIEDGYAAGATEYDMLRGDEAYKKRWTSTMREEYEISFASRRLQALLYAVFCVRFKSVLKRSRFISMLHHRVSFFFHKRFTFSRQPAFGIDDD